MAAIEFNPKKYLFKGYMWFVVIDHENEKNEVIKKDLFHQEIFITPQTYNIQEMVQKTTQLMNHHLSKYLKSEEFYRFFPFRSLTADWSINLDSNDVSEFEICYYQNVTEHNYVYQELINKTSKYILEPIWTQKRDTLYNSYGLTNMGGIRIPFTRIKIKKI